jgi:hypothetical protein
MSSATRSKYHADMADWAGSHHGDLERLVLDAALELIAAPARHFTEQADLLTAIAVEGYGMLADVYGSEPLSLLDLGTRYVRFAVDHPAHVAVMLRPEVHGRNSAEVAAARARVRAVLHASVAAFHLRAGRDETAMALAAWSFAHGFVTLWPAGGAEAMTDRDPSASFRALAQTTFR